jgi:hypothetical protein
MEEMYLVRLAGECMIHISYADDRPLCGAALTGELERFGLPAKLVPGDCLCQECYCALYDRARGCTEREI